MTDTQSKLIHSKIWDLISDYADIRDELEDSLNSIRILYHDIEIAMDDISDELDAVEEHLSRTSRHLKRFRCQDSAATIADEPDKKEVLPWN